LRLLRPLFLIYIISGDSGMSKTKKGVLSFVVNNILINDSNPDANEKYHIGKVNYSGGQNIPFFRP
ncbi:hypothetical protein, partial [Sphingobacterium daejeonense]|uniref:hypothetical protein n=1 Tax=Sphingobacterium daejeonense TaxID=371142 RepID=UPI003D31956D